MKTTGTPTKQGLYDPRFEHDACGIGFVADIKGRKSHDVVLKAIQVLLNLEHRGACGCEANTGDGAGILLQLPDSFFRQHVAKLKLPAPGEYGVGVVFLPRNDASRQRCEQALEKVVRDEGQKVLGWRTIPTDNRPIGESARRVEPVMRQVFIKKGSLSTDRPAGNLAFERKLS